MLQEDDMKYQVRIVQRGAAYYIQYRRRILGPLWGWWVYRKTIEFSNGRKEVMMCRSKDEALARAVEVEHTFSEEVRKAAEMKPITTYHYPKYDTWLETYQYKDGEGPMPHSRR